MLEEEPDIVGVDSLQFFEWLLTDAGLLKARDHPRH